MASIGNFYFCLLFVNVWTNGLGQERTVLPNLRQFAEKGKFGRFMVPRGPVAEDLQRRKEQDFVCGNNVQLELPGSNQIPCEPAEVEVQVAVFEIDDFTLNRELSPGLDNQVTIKGVAFQVPYVSGSENGVLVYRAFFESTADVSHPYLTNMDVIKKVDRIDESEDGYVAVHKGNEVLTLLFQREAECSNNTEKIIAQKMSDVVGKTFHVTSYPLPFDFWKCDDLQWNVSFCQVLKEHQCEIRRFGGDVCTQTKITREHYCPAKMTLVNATGYFLQELKFFSSFPVDSFVGDSYSKVHSNGVLYPCLSG